MLILVAFDDIKSTIKMQSKFCLNYAIPGEIGPMNAH